MAARYRNERVDASDDRAMNSSDTTVSKKLENIKQNAFLYDVTGLISAIEELFPECAKLGDSGDPAGEVLRLAGNFDLD